MDEHELLSKPKNIIKNNIGLVKLFKTDTWTVFNYWHRPTLHNLYINKQWSSIQGERTDSSVVW